MNLQTKITRLAFLAATLVSAVLASGASDAW
jgi:hypothetical protein